MAGPSNDAQTLDTTQTGFDPSVPPLHEGATPEEKDAHWLKHVYQGDKMPQLTFRAVVMGGILGMLMSVSNLYTTLAIGWSFGVAITACVMSFVIWNVVRGVAGLLVVRAIAGLMGLAALGAIWGLGFPKWNAYFSGDAGGSGALTAGAIAAVLSLGVAALVGLLWNRRTGMSILENNCMQSTAAAAGSSTGATIATMFGALLLLKNTPEGGTTADVTTASVSPWWVVAAFTLFTAALGVFLAVPMKRQMINHERLRFPSGVAAAETLRSLYGDGKAALQRAYALLAGIALGLLVGLLNTAEGSLKLIDRLFAAVPVRLHEITIPGTEYLQRQLWYGKTGVAYAIDPSLLLVAAGVITRMRVSLSMFLGSALLYFFVGPRMVALDQATPGNGWVQDAAGAWVYDKANIAKDAVINIELVGGGAVLHFTRWALWGGTALMVFASLTALALQWKTIARAFSSFGSGPRAGNAALDEIEVPTRWMVIGLVPITIALIIIQYVAFDIAWWAGLIAVAMSFVLSMVACRSTGETDTNPIGAMGKVMQLTFAVLKPGMVVPNLASAGVAANSAAASADLLLDLKSGYLLGANPRKQFIAQFVGIFFGTLAIVPGWFLMIPNKEALEKFALPATQQWAAVARVLTQGIDKLAESAKWAILIGALLGIFLPLLQKALNARFHKYLPSAMGLGLAWVIPFNNAFGFLMGAVLIWLWEMLHRKSADKYGVTIASGVIAGESLMKAFIAMSATAVGLLGK